MSFWLFDMSLFSNGIIMSFSTSSIIDFTVDVNTSDWSDVLCWGKWFLVFGFRPDWFIAWSGIWFWFNLWLNFGFMINGRICKLVGHILGIRWGLRGWFARLSWLCLLGRFWGWLIIGGLGLLFGGLGLLSRSSPGNWLHTAAEKKVIHVLFEIGSFSTCIHALLLVFDGLIIVINSEASSNFGHSS